MERGRRNRDATAEQRHEINRRITQLRQTRTPAWSQFDLAVASGVSPSQISRIERSETDFQISHLLKIAAALEVPLDELLGEL